MTFDEILKQVITLLKQQGRVSYRAIKVRFDLSDDHLEAVKDELIYAQQLAVDEDNRVLVFAGDADAIPPAPAPQSASISPPVQNQKPPPLSYTPKYLTEKILTSRSALEGERKQVTVMFADIKASTRWTRR